MPVTNIIKRLVCRFFGHLLVNTPYLNGENRRLSIKCRRCDYSDDKERRYKVLSDCIDVDLLNSLISETAFRADNIERLINSNKTIKWEYVNKS